MQHLNLCQIKACQCHCENQIVSNAAAPVCSFIYYYGILIQNRSVWEVRQYINSLGVVAPYAATVGELPYLVIILDERIVICNGVIVTYEFVMTSSLCMKPEFYTKNYNNLPQINVLAGVYDTTDPRLDEFLWSGAKDLICDSPSNSHLTLIHLSHSLNLTGLISGIVLPVAPFKDNQNCFVAGYVFRTKNVPVYQRKQAVDVYTPEKCTETFGIQNLTDIIDNVCLLSNNNIQNETIAWDCEADDGRIAVCDKTLVGFIAKALDSNCTYNTPFIFTDAGMFYKFFEKEMLFDDNKLFIGGERSFGGKRFHYIEDNSSKICSYPIYLYILSVTLCCLIFEFIFIY